MHDVASATLAPLTLHRMASERALPAAQNDALRRRLRDLITLRFGGVITHAAKALGVSHATISDVLSGKRGVGQKLLDGMANVTGQSLDALVGRSVELDPAALRGGDQLGQHPLYPTREQELRAKLARRGVAADESAIAEMQTIGMSRARPVLSVDFLMRLYEAILQDREDNAGGQ